MNQLTAHTPHTKSKWERYNNYHERRKEQKARNRKKGTGREVQEERYREKGTGIQEEQSHLMQGLAKHLPQEMEEGQVREPSHTPELAVVLLDIGY